MDASKSRLLLASCAAAATAVAICTPANAVTASRWTRTAVESPVRHGNADLAATFVAGPTDVWVAGAANHPGSTNHAFFEHWTGGKFQAVPSPRPRGAYQNFIQGMEGTGPSDVWAVGQQQRADSVPQGLIEHWDGTSWALSAAAGDEPAGSVLSAVSADAPDDVWAVGYSNPGGGVFSKPLVEHFDGSKWSVVPGFDNARAFLTVDAISPKNVWAVGIFDDDVPPVIEHFDGHSWSVIDQPVHAHATALNSLSDLGPNDVWAVGETGSDTLIEHWDGHQWSVVDSPDGGDVSALVSVVALAKDDVWAVGVAGLDQGDPLAEHWNGHAWSVTSTPTPGIADELTSVSGSPDGPVFAAGSFVDDDVPYSRRGLVLQH